MNYISSTLVFEFEQNVRNKNAYQHEELVIRELDNRFPDWRTSKKELLQKIQIITQSYLTDGT